MKEGFAAHLIKVGDQEYKSAIVLVDEHSVLQEIIPLNRETPFTRFFDGMLRLVPCGAPCDNSCAVTPGEKISVWQYYPFDLLAGCETSQTRTKLLK
ncbi:MAG: hypothetical protein RR202_02140 [Bacteroidales bacterium]